MFRIRKFSLKKRIAARTTGRITRMMKRSVNPFYGKKGMGWVKNPRRAAYSYAYSRTTMNVVDTLNLLL